MPNCPRCHQSIEGRAITCPYCRTVLKAYGHSGVTLHRATGQAFLCNSCTYHLDDTCTFPQRPYAKECTLYQNQEQQNFAVSPNYQSGGSWGQMAIAWSKRHQPWLMLLGLAVISFLLALIKITK